MYDVERSRQDWTAKNGSEARSTDRSPIRQSRRSEICFLKIRMELSDTKTWDIYSQSICVCCFARVLWAKGSPVCCAPTRAIHLVVNLSGISSVVKVTRTGDVGVYYYRSSEDHILPLVNLRTSTRGRLPENAPGALRPSLDRLHRSAVDGHRSISLSFACLRGPFDIGPQPDQTAIVIENKNTIGIEGSWVGSVHHTEHQIELHPPPQHISDTIGQQQRNARC